MMWSERLWEGDGVLMPGVFFIYEFFLLFYYLATLDMSCYFETETYILWEVVYEGMSASSLIYDGDICLFTNGLEIMSASSPICGIGMCLQHNFFRNMFASSRKDYNKDIRPLRRREQTVSCPSLPQSILLVYVRPFRAALPNWSTLYKTMWRLMWW